jgi:hypothetical protein
MPKPLISPTDSVSSESSNKENYPREVRKKVDGVIEKLKANKEVLVAVGVIAVVAILVGKFWCSYRH